MFFQPRVLYKYRHWRDPFHQNLIRKGELYLANPKSFEDKYDCHIPLDFISLTDQQIKRRYEKKSREMNPTFTSEQHKEFSLSYFEKGYLRDLKSCQKIEDKFFDQFDKQSGVLSLTHDPKNCKMWEIYADGHKGFCLGLDFKRIRKETNIFDSYDYVRYKRNLPSISPLIDSRTEKNTWHTQIFTKLKDWKFEKEYRVFKMAFRADLTTRDRKLIIPPIYFKEIILGANIESHVKLEIIDIVKQKYQDCSIYQASLYRNRIVLKEIFTS